MSPWTYLAAAVGLLAAFVHFWQRQEEDLLAGFIVSGQPHHFKGEKLPTAALLKWNPKSLATAAPRLKDVWVKDAQQNITRFTYFVPNRTLGPLLKKMPASHDILGEMATEKLFEGCAADKKRYFYSGLAEGADGLVHSDAKMLVKNFLHSISLATEVESPEAKANVWISCPSTGASTHYDMGYNVMIQLFGSKTFELLPPAALLQLAIPPTGHPHARQVLKEGGYTFSHFELQPGDALYVPPLWAHRTTTVEGVSISLNIFVGSAGEQVAEKLTTLPLPFEASWPDGMLQLATSLYLDVFLKEVGIQLKHLLARWALVELQEEQISSCNDFNIDMDTSAKIHLRGKDAASMVQVLPLEHRVPIALDYADDVLLGMLDPKVIRSVLQECFPSKPSSDSAEKT